MPDVQGEHPGGSAPLPRIGIGVPVFNGERYLPRTLDSLLAQTFTDFEICITDNASSDRTQAICEAYASRDSRVRYHRSEVNLGPAGNFHRCYELARGAYFKWNAADDMCAPAFLEKCVAVLDADPDVVLAFPRTMIIDEDDRPIQENEFDADADHPRAHVRFWRLMTIDHRCHGAHELYGVIRRSVLDRIPVYSRIVRSDSVMLARLALLGRFRRIEGEPLFLNREHRQRSVTAQTPGRGLSARSRLSRWIGQGPVPPAHFWNPALKGRINFPEWRVWLEYLRSPALADLGLAEAVMSRLALLGFTARHLPKLARDTIIGAEHLALGVPTSAAPAREPAAASVEASSVSS